MVQNAKLRCSYKLGSKGVGSLGDGDLVHVDQAKLLVTTAPLALLAPAPALRCDPPTPLRPVHWPVLAARCWPAGSETGRGVRVARVQVDGRVRLHVAVLTHDVREGGGGPVRPPVAIVRTPPSTACLRRRVLHLMTSVKRYPRAVLSTPGTSGYRLSYKSILTEVLKNLSDRVSFN